MAQRVQIQLIDDLTGKEAAETVTFGLDGVRYEIDLAAENARQLREQLSLYMEKGRKVRGRAATSQRTKASSRNNTSQIRRWAEENGFQPSRRDGSARTSSRRTRQPTPE